MAQVAGGPSAEARTRRFGAVVLADRIGSRDNNFDLLRLLAAWAVLVSHSYALVGEPQPLEQYGATLGNVGVLVFFGVSGLLIRRSWEYDPSSRAFWGKRALRLLPALATVAILTDFVLGPLVTTRSPANYFSSVETWVYPLRVTLMFPFGAGLPGVFEDNVYAGAVNGSLWSLPVEVAAYAGLAVLGVAGLLRRRRLVLGLTLLSLLWAAVWVMVTPPSVAQIFVLAAFAVGCAAYSYRDRVVLSWPIAAASLAVCILAVWAPLPLRTVAWTVSVVYLTLFLAYALPPVGRFVTRHGDASYGVYIWAFPIQQTVVQIAGSSIGPWTLIGIATPVVWVLAQLSWHLIEAPALRHKPRSSRSSGTSTTDGLAAPESSLPRTPPR
jgi:peptidoglycan/LPS O-acetylase OafA/YrhL